MKRILVTGASGFVGRQVVPLLAEAGWEVHAVSSAPRHGGGLAWHQADLLDATQRERLVTSVDASALVHLAWSSEPPRYWTDPANVRWLAATLELARLFRERGGLRMVGVGTCAEYDWTDGRCIERATPLEPHTLYGTTKAACGTVLEAFAGETGLSFAWGRLFFLFGPYDSPLRLVPSLVRSMEAGRAAVCSAGNHARDFLHVGDAAAALVAILESTVKGPVNIATGTALRVEDIARRVASHLDALDLLTVEPGPSAPALVVGDVRRLHEEVGWSPPVDTMTRLDETVRWWRSSEAAVSVASRDAASQ